MLIIFMLINISVGKPLVATGKPNPLVVALTIAATAQTAAGWLTCPPCQLDDISSFFNDYSNPEILSGTSEEVCAIKSFGDYYVELIEALSKKNILLPKSRALREEELNPYKLPACLRAIDSIEKDLIYLSKCRLKKCPDPQRIAENLLYLEFQKVLNEARSRYTDITDTHAGFTPINYC